jgi:hypothetical protein
MEDRPDGVVGSVLAPLLGAFSVLAGLFAIGAPAVAWLALVFGFFAMGEDGDAAETAGTLAILGSQTLAILVVFSAPSGIVAAVLGAPLARYYGGSAMSHGLGLALNLIAPITWLVTWAAVIGGLLWLFQDFHV